MKLATIIAFLVIGCTSAYDVDMSKVVEAPEGATEAVSLALASYQIPPSHAPAIYWYGKGLTCDAGYDMRGWLDGTDCIDGAGRGSVIVVSVVPLVGELEWFKTALCHELGHEFLELTTGHPDAQHTTAVFAAGGEVEQCEDVLQDWQTES